MHPQISRPAHHPNAPRPVQIDPFGLVRIKTFYQKPGNSVNIQEYNMLQASTKRANFDNFEGVFNIRRRFRTRLHHTFGGTAVAPATQAHFREATPVTESQLQRCSQIFHLGHCVAIGLQMVRQLLQFLEKRRH